MKCCNTVFYNQLTYNNYTLQRNLYISLSQLFTSQQGTYYTLSLKLTWLSNCNHVNKSYSKKPNIYKCVENNTVSIS